MGTASQNHRVRSPSFCSLFASDPMDGPFRSDGNSVFIGMHCWVLNILQYTCSSHYDVVWPSSTFISTVEALPSRCQIPSHSAAITGPFPSTVSRTSPNVSCHFLCPARQCALQNGQPFFPAQGSVNFSLLNVGLQMFCLFVVASIAVSGIITILTIQSAETVNPTRCSRDTIQ